MPSAWLVEILADALVDFNALSSPERTAVLNVLDKLSALGPQLPPPHMKPLKDEPGLLELRPKAGRSPTRPIYARYGRSFKVLAIARTKDDFAKTLITARTRAEKLGIPPNRK